MCLLKFDLNTFEEEFPAEVCDEKDVHYDFCYRPSFLSSAIHLRVDAFVLRYENLKDITTMRQEHRGNRHGQLFESIQHTNEFHSVWEDFMHRLIE